MKSEKNYFVNYICILFIFFITPFFVLDGYFNMIEAKTYIMWILGIILCLYTLIDFFVGFIKRSSSDNDNTSKKPTVLDIALIIFVLQNIVSAMLSKYRIHAFFGTLGWRMGSLSLIFLTIIYLSIRRSPNFSFKAGIILIPNIIIFLIGITDAFKLDIFHFHKYIYNDYFDYIGTIGNTNWYAGYLSLVLPIFIVAMLNTRSKILYIIYTLTIDLGILNIIACNCDSVYIGLGVSMVLIINYCIDNKDMLNRLYILLINAGLMYLLAFITPLYYKGDFVNIKSISKLILDTKLFVLFIISGIIMLTFTCVFSGKLKADRKLIHILFNMLVITIVSLTIFHEITEFNDHWGSDRGIVWKGSIQIFKDYPLKYKLIGVGSDCFEKAFMPAYSNQVVWNYQNAHNEFIQYLLTNGIIGLLSYCFIWFSIIYMLFKAIRKKSDDTILIIALISSMSYLGQAIVNNPLSLNMSILYLMFGLISYCNSHKHSI